MLAETEKVRQVSKHWKPETSGVINQEPQAMSADTPEPEQAERTPAPIHDISNALHAKWCSDVPNDGTYTLHLNEVETIRFFEMTDRIVAAAVSAACAERDREIEALKAAQEINDSEFTQVVFEKFKLEQQLTAALGRAKELEEALKQIESLSWPITDPLNVIGGNLAAQRAATEKVRLIARQALAAKEGKAE